jgi:membrane protein implicated in regulation of membrane protease activity
MNWESFYLICFGVGLLLSVLSFAGGFGHMHLGHLHLGHGAGHHASAGHSRGNGLSPFNMFTAMAFLCWFGGAGFLLTHYRLAIVPIIFALAVGVGLGGAALIFGFLAKVLLPRERTLLPEDTDMRGVVATVSSELRPNALGEILFSLDGTRRGAAARSEDGQPIPRDSQVLVMRYEQGVAYVRPFDDLDELEAPGTSRLTPT